MLLRVSKAPKDLIDSWAEGVSLERRSSRRIEELRHRAAADRVGLALELRRRGDRLLRLESPPCRDAISRYYYSMYHAVRALVYFVHGGDENEKHSVVPTHLPPDFDDVDVWKNVLKNARTVRNAADYDPYPKAETAWKQDAEILGLQAAEFVTLCRRYLRGKGCLYL